jgi:poly(3-hydroxybutyrate) depolymerase
MKASWLGLVVLLAGCALASGAQAARVKFECPAGYRVKEGLNTGFPHDGELRAFIVALPADLAKPAPVWVPLTGTVESTNENLFSPRSGANALMTKQGFLVIGPVRNCSKEDPADRSQACNGPGRDGWNWMPWREGRAAGPAGDKWRNDPGPDVTFLEAVVKCVGTRWKLDPRRLYLGGVSSGGTLTNRSLTFASDFWAGGLAISGEWYVTADDGSPLAFDAARRAVADQPDKVFQGRVGPFPLRTSLGPMIVITVWGGARDVWYCGAVLCADYRPSTQAASNYFSGLPGMIHVACTVDDGHRWPQVNTQAFNAWALATLASHPKGADPKRFRLSPPPDGYSCSLGRFTDHYASSAAARP